jgi:hypothetical protein
MNAARRARVVCRAARACRGRATCVPAAAEGVCLLHQELSRPTSPTARRVHSVRCVLYSPAARPTLQRKCDAPRGCPTLARRLTGGTRAPAGGSFRRLGRRRQPFWSGLRSAVTFGYARAGAAQRASSACGGARRLQSPLKAYRRRCRWQRYGRPVGSQLQQIRLLRG